MWRFSPAPERSSNDENWDQQMRHNREEKDRLNAVKYRDPSSINKKDNGTNSRGKYINLDGSRTSW